MKLAFLSDIHFGVQEDLRAYHFAVQCLDYIAPDEVFLGGDIYDHYNLSRYSKVAQKKDALQYELDSGFAHLSLLRETLPNAEMYFYRGNHEKRHDRQIGSYESLECLKPRSLYRLDDLNIHYIDQSEPVRRGHLWLAHGDEFNTGGENPAARALNSVNSNILFGHVHRFSVAHKRQLNKREIGGWSNACLCKLDPEWRLNPNWVQGFTLVDFTKNGYFNVQQITFWRSPKLNAVIDGLHFVEMRNGTKKKR